VIPVFDENRTRHGLWSVRCSLVKKHFIALSLLVLLTGCSQESQNQWGRSLQNWTGVNGILEIYAGEKLVKRFIQVDKLTTASATQGGAPRPYRFGYGILDENMDGLKSADENRVYFEFSDYSTSYIFHESPR
jgi:hypothetical protein